MFYNGSASAAARTNGGLYIADGVEFRHFGKKRMLRKGSQPVLSEKDGTPDETDFFGFKRILWPVGHY